MGSERPILTFVALTCFVMGAVSGVMALNAAVSAPISGGVPLGAPDGMTVTVDGDTNADLRDFTILSGTVDVVTDAGNATFYSAGPANATVHKDDLEGTWTNVSEIGADTYSIQINPEDKDQVTVGKQIQSFAWRAGIAADDGTVDFSYSGTSGNSRATVRGLAANTRVAAFSSSGTILDVATSDGNGVVTFDELDAGIYDVRIQQFDPAAPTLSNPQPTGETAQPPNQVAIDVGDDDFANGDTVTVTVDVDGSQVHEETISSPQTVTASVPTAGQTGGSHSWTVTAADDFGEVTTETYNYEVPTELRIYDEETAALIDNQTVNMTVYTRDSTPEILSFNTSNGVVDLGSGFPSTEPFVVVAESDGYLNRRIFVQDIYETQQLYLLNETLQHTQVIFRIEDYTGSYPPDQTTLQVQRGIDGNWTTVLGDYFGANDQFTSQIRYNTRHRLVLRNAQTGERRVLGTYTPLTSTEETITVSPEGDLALPDEFPSVSFKPSIRTLPAESGVDLSASISRGSDDLTEWSVAGYHISPTGTNTTLFSESGSDPAGGTRSGTVDLAGREGTVKVVTGYEIESGVAGSRIAEYSIDAGSGRSMTLIDGIVGVVGLVPGQNQDSVLTLTGMILVILGTLGLGSVFRLTSEGMGLVTLALVAAFSVIGWLPYSLLFTVLVLFGALAFLRRRY